MKFRLEMLLLSHGGLELVLGDLLNFRILEIYLAPCLGIDELYRPARLALLDFLRVVDILLMHSPEDPSCSFFIFQVLQGLGTDLL